MNLLIVPFYIHFENNVQRIINTEPDTGFVL